MQKDRINFSQYKDFSLQIGRSLMQFKINAHKPGFMSRIKSKPKAISPSLTSAQSDVIEPQNLQLIRLNQEPIIRKLHSNSVSLFTDVPQRYFNSQHDFRREVIRQTINSNILPDNNNSIPNAELNSLVYINNLREDSALNIEEL